MVYLLNHPVDKQYTVSSLGRYSFSWVNGLLSLAKVNKGLDLKDLPCLHLGVRSHYLHDRLLNKIQNQDRLWKTLLSAYYSEVLFQTALSILHSVLTFAPSVAMYKFLQLLEERSEGEAVNNEAWAWIVGLGSSLIIMNSVETWLFWIVWARFGALLRSGLSASIVTKATRRKDVKFALQNKGATAKSRNGSSISSVIGDQNDKGMEDDDEDMQKSRQAQINLVAIDTKRVSDFATFWYLFPETIVRIVVSVWFLVVLIGWTALLAGFGVFVLVLPLNVYASQAYSKTQGELMTVRDSKMVG